MSVIVCTEAEGVVDGIASVRAGVGVGIGVPVVDLA